MFEVTLGFEIFGNQRVSLIGVFLFDVSSDGPAFVDDVAIIVLDARIRGESQSFEVHKQNGVLTR